MLCGDRFLSHMSTKKHAISNTLNCERFEFFLIQGVCRGNSLLSPDGDAFNLFSHRSPSSLSRILHIVLWPPHCEVNGTGFELRQRKQNNTASFYNTPPNTDYTRTHTQRLSQPRNRRARRTPMEKVCTHPLRRRSTSTPRAPWCRRVFSLCRLAKHVVWGHTITLLCPSVCTNLSRSVPLSLSLSRSLLPSALSLACEKFNPALSSPLSCGGPLKHSVHEAKIF